MPATLKPSKNQAALQQAATASAEKLSIISQEMAEETKTAQTKQKKAKEVQMLTLNVPREQYDTYKKLFGAAGYSLAKGTRMCLDYVYREIQSGNLELTESGLRETLAARLAAKQVLRGV